MRAARGIFNKCNGVACVAEKVWAQEGDGEERHSNGRAVEEANCVRPEGAMPRDTGRRQQEAACSLCATS